MVQLKIWAVLGALTICACNSSGSEHVTVEDDPSRGMIHLERATDTIFEAPALPDSVHAEASGIIVDDEPLPLRRKQ